MFFLQPGASNRDLEVVAEDEQQFLLRQQQYLQQGAPPPSAGGGGIPSVQKTPDRKNVGSPGVQGSPKKVGKHTLQKYVICVLGILGAMFYRVAQFKSHFYPVYI